MQTKISYLDLFSGIGGFRLGLELAGFSFSWEGHSEIDRYAKSIYRRHFPESLDLGDVKEIDPAALPEIDLVTFGFPCQDLSNIGKRRGLHGERSGLFFEAMRIVRDARPKVFIFENVYGLLFSSRGRDIQTVLETIADIGLYECEGQLLNTAWLLPQNRERFYLVGHLRGKSSPKVFPFTPDNEACRGIRIIGSTRGLRKPSQRVLSAEGISSALVTSSNDYVLDPRHVIDRRSMKTKRSRLQGKRLDLKGLRRRARKLTPLEKERLQGFPDGWTAFGIDDAGIEVAISDNQRGKALGNAVSVPVVQAIGMRLIK